MRGPRTLPSLAAIALVALILLCHQHAGATQNDPPNRFYIDFGGPLEPVSWVLPISPNGQTMPLFSLGGGYYLDARDAVGVGLGAWRSFGAAPDISIKNPYPGLAWNYSVGLGYTRYVWKSLFLSFGLDPQFEAYYGEDREYLGKGFQLWVSLMPGYSFDFKIAKQPCYINVFFEFDYMALSVDADEPPAFRGIDGKTSSRFIFSPYFVPDVSMGIKL